ncbi:MAG: hypothetical protein ACJ72N_11665 [Labedaea sp.]
MPARTGRCAERQPAGCVTESIGDVIRGDTIGDAVGVLAAC